MLKIDLPKEKIVNFKRIGKLSNGKPKESKGTNLKIIMILAAVVTQIYFSPLELRV